MTDLGAVSRDSSLDSRLQLMCLAGAITGTIKPAEAVHMSLKGMCGV